MKKLERLPEFRALTKAYAALEPLSPEGRRKVIEALHSLLAVSAGRQGQDRPKTKSRRRR